MPSFQLRPGFPLSRRGRLWKHSCFSAEIDDRLRHWALQAPVALVVAGSLLWTLGIEPLPPVFDRVRGVVTLAFARAAVQDELDDLRRRSEEA